MATCLVVMLMIVSNALAFVSFDQPTGSTCCFTSLAMIVTNLTGQRETPRDIFRQFSYDMAHDGSGRSLGASFSLDANVARRYYLNLHQYTTQGSLAAGFSDARNAIKHGGLGVLHVQYGHFTGARHCVVLRKVLRNGNFLISDPNRHGKHGDSERRQGWSERYLLTPGEGGAFRLSVFR
jgi:hypothetical protein